MYGCDLHLPSPAFWKTCDFKCNPDIPPTLACIKQIAQLNSFSYKLDIHQKEVWQQRQLSFLLLTMEWLTGTFEMQANFFSLFVSSPFELINTNNRKQLGQGNVWVLDFQTSQETCLPDPIFSVFSGGDGAAGGGRQLDCGRDGKGRGRNTIHILKSNITYLLMCSCLFCCARRLYPSRGHQMGCAVSVKRTLFCNGD